jgi:hypothetical protein
MTHTYNLGTTPLDEGWACRRDLYLTTHNIHKRQVSMPTKGFEPAIPASERPQTHALDRVATGIEPLPLLRAVICQWTSKVDKTQYTQDDDDSIRNPLRVGNRTVLMYNSDSKYEETYGEVNRRAITDCFFVSTQHHVTSLIEPISKRMGLVVEDLRLWTSYTDVRSLKH